MLLHNEKSMVYHVLRLVEFTLPLILLANTHTSNRSFYITSENTSQSYHFIIRTAVRSWTFHHLIYVWFAPTYLILPTTNLNFFLTLSSRDYINQKCGFSFYIELPPKRSRIVGYINSSRQWKERIKISSKYDVKHLKKAINFRNNDEWWVVRKQE